jgi:hypothetical protein
MFITFYSALYMDEWKEIINIRDIYKHRISITTGTIATVVLNNLIFYQINVQQLPKAASATFYQKTVSL